MKLHRTVLVLAASPLLWFAPAMARTGNDGDYGYHVADDPIDLTGERYRVSVRHCRALEEAMLVLADRHGWLISVEASPVYYTGDIVTVVRETTGEADGDCMRPVEFAVDYSATDPFVAVQTVLDAYNAAEPPFTAKVEWCEGNLCVTGSTSKASDGSVGPAESLLDTLVTPTGSTRRELLEDAIAQVAAAKGIKLAFDAPLRLAALLDEDAGVTFSASIPARDVFAQVANGYNQQVFDAAWTRRTSEGARAANRETIAQIHGQYLGYAHRQGLTEAQRDAEWAVMSAQLEAQLAPVVEPAPSYTNGLGPGLLWHLMVEYTAAGPREYWLGIREASSPDLLAWDARLPGTVPVPGRDADQDGVADPVDQCADTPASVLVLWTGCSVAQTCPCDGTWANNGAYNGCVRDAVDTLVSSEALPRNEKGQYTQTVSESGCTQ